MKKILLLAFSLLVLVTKAQETILWSEDFNDENVSDWKLYNVSGTGLGWYPIQNLGPDMTAIGTPFLDSPSYTNGNDLGYLHPDEWAVTPQIDLTNVSEKEKVRFGWKLINNLFTPSPNEENYEIYISELNTVAGMLAQPIVYTELNIPISETERYVDISSWKGKKIYIGIRHHNKSTNIPIESSYSSIQIDDVKVSTIIGCTTATFGQYPQSLFIPTLDGVKNTITDDGGMGEYSVVQLKAGITYDFSTSNSNIYNTISTESQDILISGLGVLTYTSPVDQNIHFYSHKNNNCAADFGVYFAKYIRVITACEQNRVAGTSTQYFEFGGVKNQKLAVDVTAPSNGDFTIYGLEPILYGDATTFKVNFYENETSNLPGSLYLTKNATVVKKELVEDNFYKYTLSFDAPMTVDAGKTYWMELESDATGWQSITESHFGNYAVGNNNDTGGNWLSMASIKVEFAYSILCSAYLATEDFESISNVKYYPNPVIDELNLLTNKKIQNISIHNISGQKLSQTIKIDNNKLDMRKYLPGVYIVNVTLVDGKSESIKVIKK